MQCPIRTYWLFFFECTLLLKSICLFTSVGLVNGNNEFIQHSEAACQLDARHWSDKLHGSTPEGVPIIDGFMICKSVLPKQNRSTVKLINGTLIISDPVIKINSTWSVFEVALHLEQHSIVWPGWKHVAVPLRIKAGVSGFDNIRYVPMLQLASNHFQARIFSYQMQRNDRLCGHLLWVARISHVWTRHVQRTQ